MKKLLLAMSALAALSLLAPSTGVAQQFEYNQIGIFTAQNVTPETAQALASYTGAPGQITAYVVILNPRNYNFGSPGSGVESDITVIGGFEFRIVVPANVFLLSATLPPNSTNFANSPDFLCGSNLPVSAGRVATCLTLTLGEFGGTPSLIYLTPVTEAPQSIPGKMAITDFSDDFRLNEAYPASGAHALPVFGLFTDPSAVVPAEDASWSELKTLYR